MSFSDADVPPAARRAQPTEPVPASDFARQVLLADDEGMVRTTARRFLERAGFRVVEAHDGTHALDVWDRLAGAVDVLVTDAWMPGLDGHALAAALRARRPGLPVVLISGDGARPDDASEDPAWRFVGKPFAGRELVDAVRAVLGGDDPRGRPA